MNALMVIHPYKYEGFWVFDDESVGLRQEPFIAGADTIIDKATEAKGLVSAAGGFRLLFSGSPFPGHDYRFAWLREEDGGNWYHSDDFEMEGWLCPALFKYFEKVPEEIFAKFEPRQAEQA